MYDPPNLHIYDLANSNFYASNGFIGTHKLIMNNMY